MNGMPPKELWEIYAAPNKGQQDGPALQAIDYVTV